MAMSGFDFMMRLIVTPTCSRNDLCIELVEASVDEFACLLFTGFTQRVKFRMTVFSQIDTFETASFLYPLTILGMNSEDA